MGSRRLIILLSSRAAVHRCPLLSVHPRLQFISHLPITVYGEQLIAQILRLIPNRNWLFRFGRVKMNLLLSEYVWQVSPVCIER